jgi:N-hydroxyarylamine O-acetyltransferase
MQRSEITAKYLQSLELETRPPDLQFLSDIVRRHLSTFSFSSVGPRLGEELPLDLKSLYQRIVVQHRGGYCFEQNGLVYEILQELGFQVELYLARVIYNKDIHPGLTHRVTLVHLQDQRYIADAGFGPLGPARPVPMPTQATQLPTQGRRIFRIAEPNPGDYHMQTTQDGDFYSLYKFELSHYGQADCEVGHFYSHRHPQAAFVNNLVVSRILDREIRSLRNNDYRVLSIPAANAQPREQQITSPAQLRTLLETKFHILVTEPESQLLFTGVPPV